MHNTILERYARRHVLHLRNAAKTGCPNIQPTPDDHLLAPKFDALRLAVADLLEAFLDIDGGVDGVAQMRDALHDQAARLLGCLGVDGIDDPEAASVAAMLLPEPVPARPYEEDLMHAAAGVTIPG